MCGNDFSSDNFIYSIIKDAVNEGTIRLKTALDSEKDYISINDVVDLILTISQKGNLRLYNVASGVNISHRQIIDVIRDVSGCKIIVDQDAKTVRFPQVNIQRIKSEFGFTPANCLELIRKLASYYKKECELKRNYGTITTV